MIKKYSLGKRCIAYLLLINLLLQSCLGNSNSTNPPRLPVEQERDKFRLKQHEFTQGKAIDEGSHGKIFECTLRGNKGFVLKKIKSNDDPQKRAKIEASAKKELDLLKHLNHTNIVRLEGYHIPESPKRDLMVIIKNIVRRLGYHNFESPERDLMIIMKRYDMSLHKYLDNRCSQPWYKPQEILLNPQEILSPIAEGILKGLVYLHSERIVHRDINPNNVLVNVDNNNKITSVCLTDFGTAKLIQDIRSSTTITGTLKYMAPELREAYYQGEGKEGKVVLNPKLKTGQAGSACQIIELDTSKKVDVYSFGRLLYQCITGKEPKIRKENLELPAINSDKDYDIVAEMYIKSTQVSPTERPSSFQLLEILQSNVPAPEQTSIGQDANSNESVQKQNWPSFLKSYISPWKLLLAVFVGIIAILLTSFSPAINDSIQNRSIVDNRLCCDMHYNGNFFIPQNHTQARDCYEKYADQWEYTSGPINLCHIYVNEHGEKNYKAAVKWCKKAAEQGHPFAQGRLGYMYQNGYGVTQSYKSAMEWAQKAADQGDSWAQETLGFLYHNGQGVVKDLKKAAEWFQKAADQGNALAQHSLGSLYLYELNDHNKSLEWFRKALEKLQKAADQGDEHAQHRLGEMYRNGQGVTQDYKKSFEWYKKAADQGNQWSQNALGCMYQDGYGVEKNRQKAIEWFRRSAAQGNQAARDRLRALGAN